MNFEIYSIAVTFITNILECFVYHIVLKTKYKKYVSWIFYIVLTVLQEIYVLEIGRNNFQTILSNLILIFFVVFFFKNSIKEKILVLIFIYSLSTIPDLICSLLLFSVDKNKTINLILIHTLFLVLYTVFNMFFAIVWRSVEKIDLNKRITLTLLFPLWIILLQKVNIIMMNYDIISSGMQTTDFDSLVNIKLSINTSVLMLMIITDILFLVVYSVLFVSIIKEVKRVQINEIIKFINYENEMNCLYYNALQKDYATLQKYKHDLNNIVSVIKILKENSPKDSVNLLRQLNLKINQLNVNEKGE